MASKPGRPPNITTRHGNGPGWGGPAKAAGHPFPHGNPGDPSKWPTDPEKQARRAAEAEAVLDRMRDVALGDFLALPSQVQAQAAFLARVVGEPEKTIQHTGKNGGPIETIDKSPVAAARAIAFLLAAGAAATEE